MVAMRVQGRGEPDGGERALTRRASGGASEEAGRRGGRRGLQGLGARREREGPRWRGRSRTAVGEMQAMQRRGARLR